MKPNDEIYDAIIVGAGPAGLSTALECGKMGLKILLLEESPFLETEKSWITFESAIKDYPLLKKASTNEVNRLKFYSEKEFFDSGETSIKGYLIEQSLMNKAYEAEIKRCKNCKILDKTLYQRAKRKNNLIELQTSRGIFKGKIIVDCSGSHSVAGDDLKLSKGKFWLFMCYFLRIRKRNALDDYNCVAYSYGSSNPESIGTAGALYPNSRDYFDIGIANYLKGGGDEKEMKIKLQQQIVNLWNFYQAKGLIKKNIKIDFQKEFYSGIRVTQRRNICGDNILVVGDSAGQGSPITGEGLRPGLYYGEIAARIISQAIEKNDYSKMFLKKYALLCKKKPLYGYRYGLLIQKLIKNNLISPPFKKFQDLYNQNNKFWTNYGLKIISNEPLSLKETVKVLRKFCRL